MSNFNHIHVTYVYENNVSVYHIHVTVSCIPLLAQKHLVYFVASYEKYWKMSGWILIIYSLLFLYIWLICALYIHVLLMVTIKKKSFDPPHTCMHVSVAHDTLSYRSRFASLIPYVPLLTSKMTFWQLPHIIGRIIAFLYVCQMQNVCF